jgi:hypothetical protein
VRRERRPPDREGRVAALDDVRAAAPELALRALVEDEPAVGGVVVSEHDDGVLRVAVAALGGHVPGGALRGRDAPREARVSVLDVLGEARERGGRGHGGQRAGAARGGQPGRGPRDAQRDQVAPGVRPHGLLLHDRVTAGLAQPVGDPVRRPALPLRRRPALAGGERLDDLACLVHRGRAA